MSISRSFPVLVGRLALACVTLLLASCSTQFKERYYVGVYEEGVGAAQFYRFRLHGWSSLFSKTRYEAGWYDAAVVDRLFGQIRPKLSTPTGELPSAADTPIDVIPIIHTSGQVSGGDPSIKAENCHVTLHVQPQVVTLEGLDRIEAEGLIVTVVKTGDNNGKPTTELQSLRVAGRIEARYGKEKYIENVKPNPLRHLLESQFVDIRNHGSDSTITCSSLDALHVSGGVIDLISERLESANGAWTGGTKQAISRSPYHFFAWDGGTFEILDGDVTPAFHGLVAKGSIAKFQKKDDKNKIEVRAQSGGSLRLRGAKLTLSRVVVRGSISTAEKQGKLEGLKTLKALKAALGEKGAKRLELKLKALKGGSGEKPITLSKVVLELKDSTMKIVGGELKIAEYTAHLIKVASGHFQLTTARAVQTATESGKSVVFKDPHRKTFLHFGPEGRGSAQREDERFVIFMSASPRVMVNRIRALVNSKRTQNVIATAMLAPRLVEEQTKLQATKDELGKAQQLAETAKAFIDGDSFKDIKKSGLAEAAVQWSTGLGNSPLGILGFLQAATVSKDTTKGEAGP